MFFARHRTLYLTMPFDFAKIRPHSRLFVLTSILKLLSESRSFLYHYFYRAAAVDYGALLDLVFDNFHTNRCLGGSNEKLTA